MKVGNKLFTVLAVTLITLCASGSFAGSKSEDYKALVSHLTELAQKKTPIYTAYNMRYARGGISSINYKVQHLIPVGTKVSKITINDDTGRGWDFNFEKGKVAENLSKQFDPMAEGDGVWFKTNDGESYNLIFYRRSQKGKNIFTFAKRMFSETSREKLFVDMDPEIAAAIKAGEVLEGMTMAQVVLSMGIVPSHVTPDDMENHTWVYWTSRNRRKTICFDDKKLAVACENYKPVKKTRKTL